MLDPIESAISAAYTDWVEDYQVTHSSQDLVRGTFLGQEGIVYGFRIDPEGVEFQESRQDTADFNDYFLAQLHSAGANYHGDSAYNYWQGVVNADVRIDRGAAKCKPGNVPCNGQCLPKGHKCRSQGGGLKQGGKLRNVGHFAGKVAETVVVSAIASAVLAGGIHLAKKKFGENVFGGGNHKPASARPNPSGRSPGAKRTTSSGWRSPSRSLLDD